MNEIGFYISELKITGDNKKAAAVNFDKGFNLIIGVSDTGKSYIFACLNYMLGKQGPPKSIPESIGYTNFYLGIKTYDGKSFTFFRKLNSESIHIKECDVCDYSNSKIKSEEYFINLKKKKNISSFILQLNGIEEKFLKRSKSSKVNLIFSYLRKLSMISETRVVVEDSPFYPTSQLIDRTLYQSLLIYLLTGKDFTAFVPEEKEDIRKSRLKGQIEFVEKRIEHLSNDINELCEIHSSVIGKSIDTDLEQLEKEALTITAAINELSKTKSELFKEVEKRKSSIIFINELLERMQLLNIHYSSDLNRLSFIDEGQNLLSQLKTVNCPLCEAEMKSEKLQEIEENITVRDSIDSEKEKIIGKLKDLDSTIVENKKELLQFEEELNLLMDKYEDVDRNISEMFKPKLNLIKSKIANLKETFTSNSKLAIFEQELNYYIKEQKNLEILVKLRPTQQVPDNVDENLMISYIIILKDVLKSWNYPNSESIVFDPNFQIFDFVLSGKARSAFGKGMRAVSYTAVLFALVKYCQQYSIPFTRNLIVDSPLTTYHGKEKKTEDDEIDINVEHSFFKFFAHENLDFQFIMLDNKEPKDDLINKFNYIKFSGEKGVGRYGFFPIDNKTD